MPKTDITAERARELVEYDPLTGIVKRKKNGNITYGDRFDCSTIKLDGKSYSTLRVLWVVHTGAWPVGYVRQRDGRIGNRKWDNLYLSPKARG